MSTQTDHPTTSPYEWDLTDRLHKAMKVAGVNAKELAEAIGLTRQTVGKYLNGGGVPKRPVIVAWAIACGVSPTWLETGTFPPGANDPEPGQGIHAFTWMEVWAKQPELPFELPAVAHNSAA